MTLWGNWEVCSTPQQKIAVTRECRAGRSELCFLTKISNPVADQAIDSSIWCSTIVCLCNHPSPSRIHTNSIVSCICSTLCKVLLISLTRDLSSSRLHLFQSFLLLFYQWLSPVLIFAKPIRLRRCQILIIKKSFFFKLFILFIFWTSTPSLPQILN